jgi:hypothetical protein
MRMLSGFPSAKDENGGTKGGMILAKIAPAAPTSTPRTLLPLRLCAALRVCVCVVLCVVCVVCHCCN